MAVIAAGVIAAEAVVGSSVGPSIGDLVEPPAGGRPRLNRMRANGECGDTHRQRNEMLPGGHFMNLHGGSRADWLLPLALAFPLHRGGTHA